MAYLRFVISRLDRDSGRRQGLFQAVKALRETNRLTEEDEMRLDKIRGWFNANLEKPERLSLSTRPNSKAQAIGWFKDTAVEHIRRMREFQTILERYGLHVEVIKAKRLGYVLYEDEFQIAAYPFSDTPT